MANSIHHWGLADGNALARTVGRLLKDRLPYTPEEFIEAAEAAAGSRSGFPT
jgi:hypothetical protein